MVNIERAEAQLILHEGIRSRPYQDTRGNWTIGVGYNLTARGTGFMKVVLNKGFVWPNMRLSREDALTVLRADILRIEGEIAAEWPFWTTLDEVRQRVVLDMCYNLGHKAETFVETKALIEAGAYEEASKHLYKSAWAGQVGDGPGGHYDRADRLAEMLRTGEDYTK